MKPILPFFCLTVLIVPIGAAGQEAAVQRPLQDPWVPPAVRKSLPQESAHAPTQGAALRAQVEAKLKSAFDAADVERSGTITLAQARAAGLGRIADNFRAIDVAQAGRVSFEDYKRWLRRQGADI